MLLPFLPPLMGRTVLVILPYPTKLEVFVLVGLVVVAPNAVGLVGFVFHRGVHENSGPFMSEKRAPKSPTKAETSAKTK